MNEMQVFENNEFGSVRGIEINGECWLVGKDVAERLGYANTNDALGTHVDDEDKRILLRSEIATLEENGDFPNRGLTIINESGLYSLVLSSKLPNAKAFKRWVTSEVLPSIRKRGMYATPDTVEKMLENPDVMIQALTALKEEREARKIVEEKNVQLEEKNAQLTEKAEADAPKVLFADSVTASKQSILVGELAKLMRQNGAAIGQNRLFEKLRNEGFLHRGDAQKNMPTQKAMDMGLFEIQERTIISANGSNVTTFTPKITGKGQIYFINRYLGTRK